MMVIMSIIDVMVSAASWSSLRAFLSAIFCILGTLYEERRVSDPSVLKLSAPNHNLREQHRRRTLRALSLIGSHRVFHDLFPVRLKVHQKPDSFVWRKGTDAPEWL